MKKSITALLMALCLALTLLPVQTLASSPNTAYANDPDAAQTIALQSIGPDEAAVANDLYEKMSIRASFIKLIADIDVGTLTIDYEVTIDLNGHVLKMIGSGSVFKVENGGHLTLIDSNSTAEHRFTPNPDGLWVLDEQNGTKTVSGGVIYGGTGYKDGNHAYGGGVYIEANGKLTMTGGNIIGCTATGNNAFGGGVFVSKNGTFTMTGGNITGCTAVAQGYGMALGGGIRNDGLGDDHGRTTLSGTAVIRDCHAKGALQPYGGGISDAGTLNISGDVQIIGCTAGGQGSDAMTVHSGTISGGTFYGSIKGLDNATISGHIVTYKVNGADYATQILQSGSAATQPAAPTSSTGGGFLGWYMDDGTVYDFTQPVTENLTLTAKWTRSHTNHCVCGGTSDVKHTHDVNTVWTAWTSTDSLPRDTGQYYLTDNVVLPADSDYVLDYYDESSETYYCPDLCLNGYTISFAAGGSDRKIVLENITTTQITDCQSAAGKIEPALQLADSGFGWVWVFNVTLAGGVENNGWAVCMYLYSGTLMNGITGTHADIYDSTVTGGILLSGSIGLYGSPNIDRLTLVDDEEAASPGYISRSSKLDAGVRIPITTQPLPTGQTPYELGEKMDNDLSGNLVPDAGYAVRFDADSKTLMLTKAATITMGDNSWSDFDSTAKTLYCNTDQTLTIIDNSGGKLDISCLLTQEDLTQAQMGGLLFGEYTAPIVLREEGSHILYVMLFEPPFNFSSITYLRSARIVIDKTAPVLDLTDGKTYCGAQTVTITELHLKSVTVNGKAVTVDADQRFTLPAAGKQTIVVTDLAGNSTTVTVTVNAGHTWGAWTSNGDDTHSRKCTVPGCTADSETEKCTGGKADCCHKAVCDICKATYGKVDPNNHHSLKHVKADRATTTSYGNIEYWYCEGCHRYFKDAACTIQITEDATRISPKSSSGTDNSKNGKNGTDKKGVKSSDTGDSGLHLWVTLLLTSAVLGGAVLITGKRRRTR